MYLSPSLSLYIYIYICIVNSCDPNWEYSGRASSIYYYYHYYHHYYHDYHYVFVIIVSVVIIRLPVQDRERRASSPEPKGGGIQIESGHYRTDRSRNACVITRSVQHGFLGPEDRSNAESKIPSHAEQKQIYKLPLNHPFGSLQIWHDVSETRVVSLTLHKL